eukprot:5317684-Pyramimonas_sp.AAC.1
MSTVKQLENIHKRRGHVGAIERCFASLTEMCRPPDRRTGDLHGAESRVAAFGFDHPAGPQAGGQVQGYAS